MTSQLTPLVAEGLGDGVSLVVTSSRIEESSSIGELGRVGKEIEDDSVVGEEM